MPLNVDEFDRQYGAPKRLSVDEFDRASSSPQQGPGLPPFSPAPTDRYEQWLQPEEPTDPNAVAGNILKGIAGIAVPPASAGPQLMESFSQNPIKAAAEQASPIGDWARVISEALPALAGVVGKKIGIGGYEPSSEFKESLTNIGLNPVAGPALAAMILGGGKTAVTKGKGAIESLRPKEVVKPVEAPLPGLKAQEKAIEPQGAPISERVATEPLIQQPASFKEITPPIESVPGADLQVKIGRKQATLDILEKAGANTKEARQTKRRIKKEISQLEAEQIQAEPPFNAIEQPLKVNAPVSPDLTNVRPGVTKEPWEMTKAEFGQTPRFYQTMLAEKEGLRPEQRIRNKATQKLVDKQNGKSLQLAPDAAPDYFWGEGRNLHKEIIEKVLSSGKPVPPEVLADYPDLAAKYQKPPTTASVPEPSSPAAAAPKGKPGMGMKGDIYPDDTVIWHSPHSGENVEMNFRGYDGNNAVLFNPKSGMQVSVPREQIHIKDIFTPEELKSISKSIDLQNQAQRDAIKAEMEANKPTREAEAKRIANIKTFRKINGWEIVKDGIDYLIRNPETKEEVYRGKFARAKEIAETEPLITEQSIKASVNKPAPAVQSAVADIIEGKAESKIGTKEFKARMLTELDKAIRSNEKYAEYSKYKAEDVNVEQFNWYDDTNPKVTISIPGDGEFVIANEINKLAAIQKKVNTLDRTSSIWGHEPKPREQRPKIPGLKEATEQGTVVFQPKGSKKTLKPITFEQIELENLQQEKSQLEYSLTPENSEFTPRQVSGWGRLAKWQKDNVIAEQKAAHEELHAGLGKRLKEVNTRISELSKSKPSAESGRVLVPGLNEIRSVRDEAVRLMDRLDPFAAPAERVMKNPTGAEFVSKLTGAETYGRQIHGRSTTLFESLKRPDKATHEKAVESFKADYEAGRVQATPELQKLADVWSQIQDMTATAAEQLKVKTRTASGVERDFMRERNYFPDVLSKEGRKAMVTREGPVWEALVEELFGQGKVTEGFDEYIISLQEGIVPVLKVGSVEKSRVLHLPDFVTVEGKKIPILETDPYKVIPRFIDRVSKRLGVIKEFGQDQTVIREMLRKTYGSTRVHDTIKNMWEELQGLRNPVPRNPLIRNVFLPIEALIRAKQLSAATISNLTGWIPIAEKTRLIDTVRAMKDPITAKLGNLPAQERLRILQMDDAFSKDALRGLAATEGLEGTAGKISTTAFKGTGMNWVNRQINKVGADAGLRTIEHGLDIIRKGDTPVFKRIWGGDPATYIRQLKRDFYFTDVEIQQMVKNGMNAEQRARVAQKLPSLTNAYKESVATRPLYMRHPVWQRIWSYTSFPRVMGNIAKRAVEELAHGNAVPMVKFITGGVVTGEAIIAAKNFFKNRERADKDFKWRLINDLIVAGSFGMLGEIYQNASYSIKAGQGIDVGGMINPPVLDDMAETVNSAITSVKKKSVQPFIAGQIKTTPVANMAVNTMFRMFDPKGAERERERIKKQVMSLDQMKTKPLNTGAMNIFEFLGAQKSNKKQSKYQKFNLSKGGITKW